MTTFREILITLNVTLDITTRYSCNEEHYESFYAIINCEWIYFCNLSAFVIVFRNGTFRRFTSINLLSSMLSERPGFTCTFERKNQNDFTGLATNEDYLF